MSLKGLPPLQTWRVTDIFGNPEMISAHYMFKCEQTGTLTFRYKTETESYVVATFSPNGYASCIFVLAETAKPDQLKPEPMGRPKPSRSYPKGYRTLDDEIPF